MFVMFLVYFRFNENILSDPGYIDIPPDSRIPKRVQRLAKLIPHYDKKSLRPGYSTKENVMRIKTDQDTLTLILRCVSDEEVGTYDFCLSLR